MSSLKSIPPLIPIPANSTAGPEPDAFPTPASASSDFGDFMSVPASEDPLRPMTPVKTQPRPTTGMSVQAGSALLDELLAHEDDPMYFHRTSSSTTPQPSHSPTPPTSQPAFTETIANKVQQLVDAPLQLLQDLSDASSTPILEDPPPLQHHPHSHSSGLSNSTPSLPYTIPERRHVRENSLPSSPVLASPPVLSHAESHSTISQPSDSTTRNGRGSWMSSLLSISAPHPPTAPPPAPSSGSGLSSTRPHHPLHAATMPGVSHGSPFAPHAFVPASGAPGFAGDRQWDKGFTFEKEPSARAGPKLVGRNEMTTTVLSDTLAAEVCPLPVYTSPIASVDDDMIQLRPFFPALARLPKSWRLLYSLDQHGISLKTLYARCEAHTGGVLLAIKDARGGTFGAWLGGGLHASHGAGYFGSGESFLWTARSGKQESGAMQVFKWSGKNDYVALCEPDYIALGGGSVPLS